jgi:quercetin dioxygenase-like cupin family protein
LTTPHPADRDSIITRFAAFARRTASGAAVAVAMLAGSTLAVAQPRETVTPLYSYPIAGMPGKSVTAVMVSYPPGGVTPPHRHGRAFVVAYVLEGAIRSQLYGGEERVYRAGESWTEPPGAHHVVGRNASATEPARMIAVFIADTGATDLVVIDGEAKKK